MVLRGESVETAQAGDKCDFIGTLIIVPDVSQIQTQGGCGLTCINHTHSSLAAQAQVSSRMRASEGYSIDGVR